VNVGVRRAIPGPRGICLFGVEKTAKVPQVRSRFLGANLGTAAPRVTSLLGRTGRRRTLGGEPHDGHELLQSDFEDLGNFHERLALGNGI